MTAYKAMYQKVRNVLLFYRHTLTQSPKSDYICPDSIMIGILSHDLEEHGNLNKQNHLYVVFEENMEPWPSYLSESFLLVGKISNKCRLIRNFTKCGRKQLEPYRLIFSLFWKLIA